MFDDFQDLDEEQDVSSFGSYEPDEPDGLAEPRRSDFFVGHTEIEKSLLSLINSGAMPHAIIFAGQQGIGKATLAFRLARCLLKHGTAGEAQDSLFGDVPAEITSLSIPNDDSVFAKVASGGHPDFLSLEYSLDPKKIDKKADIDVYTARKIAPFLRMTSSDGGWRVVIVDNADTMNRNAQNAILKILEEPPSNALLVLVCHRLGAMIPTIRSRCRVMHFNPLNEEELSRLMEKEVGASLSNQDKNIVNFLGQGSIGAVHDCIETGGLDVAGQVLSLFEQWPNFNGVEIHHLADQCGKQGAEHNFGHVAKTFMAVFESLVFAKAKGEQQLQPPINGAVYAAMLARYSLEDLTQICDKLRVHFAQAEYSSLDKRLAVLEAFNIIK